MSHIIFSFICRTIAALVRLVIAKLHIFCRFPILSAEKMQYDSIPNGDEYRFGCGGGQPMPSTGEYGLNPRNGRMVTRDSALQQVSLATERVKIFQNDKRADSPLQLTDIQLVSKEAHLTLRNGPFQLAKRTVSHSKTDRFRTRNGMF